MFITTLFINSVFCWSPKMVTTFYSRRKFFCCHLSDISLVPTMWILFYEALKRIMFIFTLFINSVFCWSPKMVTTFYSRRKFFCCHLSDISLVPTMWILFYEALKRIMFIFTLFINSVVCWSPKMFTTFYSLGKVFRQHLSINSLLATSWILFYEALKRILFITTFFINSVVCWSPKMVTTFYTHSKVLRKHLF